MKFITINDVLVNLDNVERINYNTKDITLEVRHISGQIDCFGFKNQKKLIEEYQKLKEYLSLNITGD